LLLFSQVKDQKLLNLELLLGLTSLSTSLTGCTRHFFSNGRQELNLFSELALCQIVALNLAFECCDRVFQRNDFALNSLILQTFFDKLTTENLLLFHQVVESGLELFAVPLELIHKFLSGLPLRHKALVLLLNRLIFVLFLFELLMLLVDFLLNLFDIVLARSAHHLLSLNFLAKLRIVASQLGILLLVLSDFVGQLVNILLMLQNFALFVSTVLLLSLNSLRDGMDLVFKFLQDSFSGRNFITRLFLLIFHVVDGLLNICVSLFQTRWFVFLFEIITLKTFELFLHLLVVLLSFSDLGLELCSLSVLLFNSVGTLIKFKLSDSDGSLHVLNYRNKHFPLLMLLLSKFIFSVGVVVLLLLQLS
jgi:hypothetical protein